MTGPIELRTENKVWLEAVIATVASTEQRVVKYIYGEIFCVVEHIAGNSSSHRIWAPCLCVCCLWSGNTRVCESAVCDQGILVCMFLYLPPPRTSKLKITVTVHGWLKIPLAATMNVKASIISHKCYASFPMRLCCLYSCMNSVSWILCRKRLQLYKQVYSYTVIVFWILLLLFLFFAFF